MNHTLHTIKTTMIKTLRWVLDICVVPFYGFSFVGARGVYSFDGCGCENCDCK